MPRQGYQDEQERVRAATLAYFNALPAQHKELLMLMAADAHQPVWAIIAGALEKEIRAWQQRQVKESG